MSGEANVQRTSIFLVNVSQTGLIFFFFFFFFVETSRPYIDAERCRGDLSGLLTLFRSLEFPSENISSIRESRLCEREKERERRENEERRRKAKRRKRHLARNRYRIEESIVAPNKKNGNVVPVYLR